MKLYMDPMFLLVAAELLYAQVGIVASDQTVENNRGLTHCCLTYASSQHVFSWDPVSFLRSKDAGCLSLTKTFRDDVPVQA